MMKFRSLYVCLATLAAGSLEPTVVAGQVAMLDEGEFLVEQNGAAIATEAFTIRSSGFGANQRVVAQGTLEWDAPSGHTSIRTALLTDGPAFTVSAYESTQTGAEEVGMELASLGDRFRAEITTTSGTQEREFRAQPGGQSVVVVDPLMPHQYYFLGRLATGEAATMLSVISPRELTQASARLSLLDTERIQIDHEDLPAQHMTLQVGDVTHHVWLDVQNRVLRAEIPSLGLVATRKSPPAH
jgi:hypothetical protein